MGWIRVTAPHFIVYSNSTATKTLYVVQTFESYHSALEQIFPNVAPDETLPTYIFVFDSTATFAPYDQRDSTGRPGGFGGFCYPGLIANYIAVNVMPGLDYRPLLYHEYVHQYLIRTASDLPLWVDEGLAEYLSTFTYHDGRATLGDPLDHHLETIRESRTIIPLSWTFGLNEASPTYSEANRAGPFYAYSWLLVHYALHDGNGRPLKLQDLLTLQKPGQPFEQSLVERMGMSLAQLEVKLHEYARKKAFGFSSLQVSASESGATIPTSEASRASVLARLGEVLTFVTHDDALAREHLRSAVELQPDVPDARAVLSWVLEREGERDLAARYFSEAIDASPADGRLYVLRGKSLLDRFNRKIGTVAEPDPAPDTTIAEARRMFEKGLSLDSNLAEGYLGLGLTYYYSSDDPAPGIAALETALRLLPARMDAAGTLAALYARVGEMAKCDELLARIERQATDPRMVRQAREAVSSAKQERAEMRRLEQIDRYNGAVRLANDRKLEEALEVLAKLGPEVEDPELAAAVDSLMDDLRTALKKP
jgi:Tfp pilus assembly protein PilF